MRGSQRSNTRVFHIPYYMWLVILASIIIGFDLFTSVRSASNTDTTSLNEADSIRQMGLVNNNNVKIIERYITEENADLGMDKPPRPWADSYRRILDVDNDWLKAEGNIVKAIYPASYIPIDIYTPKYKEGIIDSMYMVYEDKRVTFFPQRVEDYQVPKKEQKIPTHQFYAPYGFSIATITANIGNNTENQLPFIEKGKMTKVTPTKNQRLATIYLVPNQKRRPTNGVGHIVKYSQYQKAEVGADVGGKPTKVQERYRKGRPTTETLAGTFSIETNSQQRNIEISKVEESIASTQSNSSSTSNSFSTSASNTMSAEGGFGPVKAKASTTIGISNTKESSQKNSTSASQNSSTSNQTTNEGSSGQASRNTFQTTTTVNYDGKETEIVTQLQQRAGKTYQPSEYIDTWLDRANYIAQYSKRLNEMGFELKPYIISSVEEVGDYTLTASRANIINTLIRNEKQFSLVLDILASKFKQVVQKDPSFQQQLDIISGVRDALADGYYFQLVETLSDHWGGYQYSLGKGLPMGNLSSYDYALEHMLNDTIAKNMNKWSRAVRSDYLPLDLLAIMGLADKYSTEAINVTGILKIEE